MSWRQNQNRASFQLMNRKTLLRILDENTMKDQARMSIIALCIYYFSSEEHHLQFLQCLVYKKIFQVVLSILPLEYSQRVQKLMLITI